MYRVINADGSQSSPADTTQLFRWARENRLFPHSILIDEEGKTLRADSLPRLQTAFPPPQPSPVYHQRPTASAGRGSKAAQNFATVAVLFVAGSWVWNGIKQGVHASRSETGTIYTTEDGTPINAGNYAPPSEVPQEAPTSAEDQSVYENIKARIAKDHPGDYSTQKYLYKENVEAKEFMDSVGDSDIKSKVQEDHPNDYSTQHYLYKQNIEAKASLE